MKKPKLTRAEQLARHRKIFLYAREHDLTLVEAEFALLREEREARMARRKAEQSCGRALRPYQAAFVDRLADQAPRPIPANAPWMMRD